MPDLGEITTSAADGPVTFRIDGVECKAVAALPADDYAKFLGVTSRMSQVAAQFNELKEKNANTIDDATLKLFDEFNQACVAGLDLVLFDDSREYVVGRLKDRENPMDLQALSKTFGLLAGHYNSAGRDEDVKDDTAPFDSESASSSGSPSPEIGAASEPTSSAEATPQPALPATPEPGQPTT